MKSFTHKVELVGGDGRLLGIFTPLSKLKLRTSDPKFIVDVSLIDKLKALTNRVEFVDANGSVHGVFTPRTCRGVLRSSLYNRFVIATVSFLAFLPVK